MSYFGATETRLVFPISVGWLDSFVRFGGRAPWVGEFRNNLHEPM